MASRNVLVDTSIIIEHLRKLHKNQSVLYKLETGHLLYSSTVVAFELWAGAAQFSKQQEVQELLRLFTVLPFTLEISEQAAQIYRDLRNRTQVIEIRDVFIAATAVVYELPLVTLNVWNLIAICVF
jgi:tRNA(fMet)-specific endonuclease VapC